MIRMNAPLFCSIWQLEHQIHYKEGNTKYVKKGVIIHLIVHCCINTIVLHVIYFVTFASRSGMKKYCPTFYLMREHSSYMYRIQNNNVSTE
jgi:hypothetical protein